MPTLREVLARYPVPLIIELKTPEAGARAGHGRRAARGRCRRAAWPWDRSTARALRAARAYEPRIATGAAREETRWALYQVLGALANPPAGVPRVPGARAFGPDHDRDAALRAARTPRGPAGEGLDRGRPRGYRPASRLGRRRHHQQTGRTWRSPREVAVSSSAIRRRLADRRRAGWLDRADSADQLETWHLPCTEALPFILSVPDRTAARLESRHALFEICSA